LKSTIHQNKAGKEHIGIFDAAGIPAFTLPSDQQFWLNGVQRNYCRFIDQPKIKSRKALKGIIM